MEEIWKDIPNFEGRYIVSNYGKVKSINYHIKRGSDVMLKIALDKDGYFKVSLKGKSFIVHRLVAAAFIGDVSDLVVNHKDFNRQNNHVSNLEIVTTAENNLYSLLYGKEKGLYTSRFVGVFFRKDIGMWGARKIIDGKRTYFGCFLTEEDANEAIQTRTFNSNIRIRKSKNNTRNLPCKN